MIVNKQNKRGFGVSEIIGIATVLVIAAAVVIPGLREIASDIITSTKTWVGTKMSEIFEVSSGT
ncbi:MAG: hypothetical protein WC554_04455 [Clostridia bacterium]|jgi:hypothetical protein|nr:hypothetical protein [Clostridia bacterium]MDD4501718.1 hypothetical protein [Clostridia bacterium]HQM95881.1 hypothetical protein [Clostridia bacterium]HQO69186.1 hypothetical protein [Clostridia bacterium]